MLTIDIRGEIISSYEQGLRSAAGDTSLNTSAADVRQALDAAQDERDIMLDIDCMGGDVYEGFKIYDLLRNSGKTLHACIRGGCHSMATVVLLAAPLENRTGVPNLRALVHLPRTLIDSEAPPARPECCKRLRLRLPAYRASRGQCRNRKRKDRLKRRLRSRRDRGRQGWHRPGQTGRRKALRRAVSQRFPKIRNLLNFFLQKFSLILPCAEGLRLGRARDFGRFAQFSMLSGSAFFIVFFFVYSQNKSLGGGRAAPGRSIVRDR